MASGQRGQNGIRQAYETNRVPAQVFRQGAYPYDLDREAMPEVLSYKDALACKNRFYRSFFNDSACIHDVYALAHLGNDAEVMRYEDDGHVAPFL